MTFDDAYDSYRTKRDELRALQGELAKDIEEHEGLGKAIVNKRKIYRTKYKGLVEAQSILKPELDKEVMSHPLP